MEQGFIMIMIKELNNNIYIVETANYEDVIRDIDLSDDDMTISKDMRSLDTKVPENSSLMISLKNITENPDIFGMAQAGAQFEEQYYDIIDRQPNANHMLEGIVQTIANIAQATRSNQLKLIDLGVLELIKTLLLNYCPYGYLSPVKQSYEQIDVTNLTIGNVNMLKSLS